MANERLTKKYQGKKVFSHNDKTEEIKSAKYCGIDACIERVVKLIQLDFVGGGHCIADEKTIDKAIAVYEGAGAEYE